MEKNELQTLIHNLFQGIPIEEAAWTFEANLYDKCWLEEDLKEGNSPEEIVGSLGVSYSRGKQL